MNKIYWFVLALCGMTIFNVVSNLIVIARSNMENQVPEIAMAILIAIVSLYVGYKCLKGIHRVKNVANINQKLSAGEVNLATYTTLDGSLPWSKLIFPFIFLSVLIIFILYLSIINSEIGIAIALGFAYTSIFIFSVLEYQAVRTKYRDSFNKFNTNKYITGLICARSTVIWAVCTLIIFVLIIVLWEI